jgi:hypothetical protein
MKTQRPLLAILFAILITGCNKDIKPGEQPEDGLKEYTGFLKIPGVGYQTFFRFEDEDPNMKKLLFKSGSAYFRWMWTQLEPEEGKYNFDLIDQHLARARENGQTMEFRVMLEWPGEYDIGIPQWLVDKGVNLRLTHCEDEDYYSPDLEDPVIKEYHKKLIRALGARYDGHPDLGSVDIGSVGLWGEWHEYCHPELMPSQQERFNIIDLYYESFPNTPLIALVDDKKGIQYAANKGRSAWRGDCWGNYKPPGSGWNHHENSYWPADRLIPDAWKAGPVALESCWTMKKWLEDGTDIKQVVDDAISWHATLAHNKSDYVPEKFKSEIERLVMKLGFRLVLRKISYDSVIAPGSTQNIVLNWENLGIAPPYRDYLLAFRLRDAGDQLYGIHVTNQSIRGWLPGKNSVKVQLPLSNDLPDGAYTLELGLVFHSAYDHMVPIANEGKTEDGWYRVGSFDVK